MARVDPRSLPKTIDGAREAWSIVEETWAATVDQAEEVHESAVYTRVNGEWSFIETLRHLLFVTDAWIGRTVLGGANPYHRLGLPPDHGIGEPEPGVDVSAWGIDVFEVASLDEVLGARHDRMRMVRGVVDGLAPGALQQMCDANPAPGFPPSTVVPVGFCVDLVIREEWAHNQFATRDLLTLEH